MIIGVIGQLGSGKDTVAEILKEKGFIHISFSDILRNILKKQNKEITRQSLINLGNNLRKKYSPSILAKIAARQVKKDNNYVFTSIMNPSSIDYLKKRKDFILIKVEAPLKTRFIRIKDRNREQDPKTLNEFKKIENIHQHKEKHRHQMHLVLKKAKITINNNKDINQLRNKVNKLVQDHKPKYKRPSWDEYFLGIVDATAKRATCDRGRTAVVIVKDKMILATGYVGSPMGLDHCDNIGHQMKQTIHEDKSVSQHCVRTNHAEINAIALAARKGIAIEGATLYCKMAPCYTCSKMIINAGIKRVVCKIRYHGDKQSYGILKQAGVKIEVLDKTIEKYENQ